MTRSRFVICWRIRRADRVPAVLPRLYRPLRVRACHRVAAARVCAAIAGNLQRSGVHAARLHPRERAPARTGVQGCARHAQSVTQPRHAVPPAGLVLHGRAAEVHATTGVASPHGADRSRRMARPAARRRSPRREHVGTRRRRGPRRSLGTAAGVGAFARAVLRTITGEPIVASPDTLRTFISKTDVPGSSRALGWDTMLPTSSCGSRLCPLLDRPHRLHGIVALDRLGA